MSKRSLFFTYFLILLCLAAMYVLFASSLSPLYPNFYGWDSAFYRFAGLMIRRGKVLYRDLWDNKGPLLFFIQAFTTLGGTKNADITFSFLMQIASTFVTVVFLIRAGLEADGKRMSFLRILFSVGCAMALFAIVMEGGNLSEDWSMPMIACSLYLLVKYAVHADEKPLHPCRYAFIHGVCFALIAMIRINNAVSLCAGVLIIGLWLVYRKKWRNLWENILFGLLGAGAGLLPFFVYFLSKHALGDMIYAVFVYNLKYVGQQTHRTNYGKDLAYRVLPIAVSFLLITFRLLRNRRIRLLDVILLTVTAANAVMLQRINLYLHYYVIFVPVLLLVMLVCADLPKLPELLTVCLFAVFFARWDLILYSETSWERKTSNRNAFAFTIPEEEKDPVIGFNSPAGIYLNTGLIPCSRYAAYQYVHFPVDPSMQEEFLEDIRREQPYWIISDSEHEPQFPEVMRILDADYELIHSEYGLNYYRRSAARSPDSP